MVANPLKAAYAPSAVCSAELYVLVYTYLYNRRQPDLRNFSPEILLRNIYASAEYLAAAQRLCCSSRRM